MKIILAVDGSQQSLATVEEAARAPWPGGSEVRIVSAAELPSPSLIGFSSLADGSYGKMEQLIEENAAAYTAEAVARFAEIAGTQAGLTAKSLTGDAKTAILDEAEHWGADLIMLGDRGHNALQRLWLGSVSRAIASYAQCSVYIVRRREGRVSDAAMKILLATDGSEFSDAAAQEIADRPWPADSEVLVISVVHLPFTPTAETLSLPDCEYSQLEKAGREHAESNIKSAIARIETSNARRKSPLRLRSEIVQARPEEGIVETAKKWGADLIVVGSHGRRGIQRFLLGSASQAVASHAPCSVEIVRKK